MLRLPTQRGAQYHHAASVGWKPENMHLSHPCKQRYETKAPTGVRSSDSHSVAAREIAPHIYYDRCLQCKIIYTQSSGLKELIYIWRLHLTCSFFSLFIFCCYAVELWVLLWLCLAACWEQKKILGTDLYYTSQHTSELSRGSKPIMWVDGSPLT